MAIEKKELEQKLLAAQSANEVAERLKAAGHEISAEEAAELFERVKGAREQEDKKLDLDELDAVAGGGFIFKMVRNYLTEGCAATVEPGSDCWGTDGGCSMCNIRYSPTVLNQKCPTCGVYCCDVGCAICPKCRTKYEKQ